MKAHIITIAILAAILMVAMVGCSIVADNTPSSEFPKGVIESDIACTGSMEPTISCHDRILFSPVLPEDVQIGDIISFVDPVQESGVVESYTLHRVMEISDSGHSCPCFRTKGDNNKDYDREPVEAPDVIKVVVRIEKKDGRIITGDALRTPLEKGWVRNPTATPIPSPTPSPEPEFAIEDASLRVLDNGDGAGLYFRATQKYWDSVADWWVVGSPDDLPSHLRYTEDEPWAIRRVLKAMFNYFLPPDEGGWVADAFSGAVEMQGWQYIPNFLDREVISGTGRNVSDSEILAILDSLASSGYITLGRHSGVGPLTFPHYGEWLDSYHTEFGAGYRVGLTPAGAEEMARLHAIYVQDPALAPTRDFLILSTLSSRGDRSPTPTPDSEGTVPTPAAPEGYGTLLIIEFYELFAPTDGCDVYGTEDLKDVDGVFQEFQGFHLKTALVDLAGRGLIAFKRMSPSSLEKIYSVRGLSDHIEQYCR